LPFLEEGRRKRELGVVTPTFELAQMARNKSSSGDPSRKHLACQNLYASAALASDVSVRFAIIVSRSYRLSAFTFRNMGLPRLPKSE
jgi:hypothetical protein